MKHIYSLILLTSICLLSASDLRAQCTCANGDPIDSIEQVRIMTGILPFTSTVSFNKLDPSTGTLSCVRTRTTVFTRVTIVIANRDTTSRVTYQYSYTRNTSLTGPGISVSASAPRMYGPIDLGQAGVDPDTVAVFGPDTLFNNIVMNRQTSSSLGSYTGTGNVNFTYTNNAITGFVIGNSNNQTTISDYTEVTIQLIYYVCPLVVLKNQMKNLVAQRNNNNISIQWSMENDEQGARYEIESSLDGRSFASLGTLQSKGNGSQRYQYEYPVSSGQQGKMYFRVRIFDKNGKSTYSGVKLVTLGEQSLIQPTVYPNPVVNEMNISLGSPQTGKISTELLSVNGQVLQSRDINAIKLSNIQFNLNRKYPAGTYFLRVKNAQSGVQTVTRVFIQ